MSKHWRPDESVVRPLPRGKRLKSLDEFTPPEWLGSPSTTLRTGMERARRLERQLPTGSKAGLVLVAAACVGLAIGLYAAFGPRDAVASEAKAGWEGR